MLKQKINKFLSENFNFTILKYFPRHSIRFAKNHFKGKPIIAVEIGTYKGHNAENILKELNVKKLYIIDPYEEYETYLISENHQTQKRLSNVERKAKKRLKKSQDKIIWVKKYSNDAVKDVPDNIDFIYIDGNHEYEYVKKDIENYWKKVKKGGILAGHDIASFLGVAKAFVEFCYENKLTPNITRTDWWVVKE